jgi:hypothetical protein
MPINDGVPVAIVVRDRVEVFAIGNPLVRWHRRDGGPWSDAKLIDANLPAGGLAASVTSDSRIDVFGLGAGGLQHWPAGIGAADRKSWVNWGGNQRTQPEGICSPVSLEELVAIARSATRANKRVRAVGSSWSLSDVAVTDGFVVETSKLDRLLDTVVPHALIDSPRSIIQGRRPFILKPNQLVHVEAGIQVEQLMLALDGKQLAPGTMGGSSGQTLAGVLSTSVHGSHFRLPPFPDWVRALHLVGPDGTQYPITKDAELRQALGPGVAVVRDNNWYNATIASVGSLGIVYSVILEVREAYKMTVNRSRDTWSKIRPRLADGSLFTEGGPDSVYVSIDPGTSMATGDPDCYVTSRVNVSKDVPSKPASTDTMSEGLAAFCNNHQLLPITYAVAAATPAIYGSVLGALAAVPGIELASPVLVPLVAALTPVVATADLAVPILISILKTAGPGAVGDFVGVLLDKHPSETAAVISSLTRSQQPLGPNIVVDDAHRVMAPWDSTECVARGLALEIALDATAGGHIRYVDAVIAALRDEAQMGRFLGGWISVRFVGMSRAFLSPHKSAMTCTVEYTGLRTLSSTKPLLLKLEALGRDHGAIQHWGMFLDLNPGDVESAYPHLDTWRRVRWELTRGGTITTFDSNFTRRCGLSDPPNPLPGLGKDIGVGADGSVWMIGTNPVGAASDFGVYKWNGTNWDGVDGGGVRIAVGPDGTPWMVNSAGQIFHRQGNSWKAPLPGLGKDIGVGADASVWMIGTNPVGTASDFGVYKRNGMNWDGLANSGGVSIAVDPRGRAWLVNSAGQIFRRS